MPRDDRLDEIRYVLCDEWRALLAVKSDNSRTFSNDTDFAAEQGKKGGQNQPDEIYKPSEHDGKKEDGTDDARMSSEHGFGGDRERASEAGKKGGKTQPDEVYKPSEHGGLKKDGTVDKRTQPEHGFGGDRERAAEMGRLGGAKNSTDDE